MNSTGIYKITDKITAMYLHKGHFPQFEYGTHNYFRIAEDTVPLNDRLKQFLRESVTRFVLESFNCSRHACIDETWLDMPLREIYNKDGVITLITYALPCRDPEAHKVLIDVKLDPDQLKGVV